MVTTYRVVAFRTRIFNAAGGIVLALAASAGAGTVGTPTIQDRVSTDGGYISFPVDFLGKVESVTWYRNGLPLTDGLQPDGTNLVGATTTTLVCEDLGSEFAGTFQCAIESSGGTLQSNTATLTVVPITPLDPVTGHAYILACPGSYSTVLADSATLGGYLACIGSAAENDFIAAAFKYVNVNQIYIGLSDEVTEGDFQWANGEPVVYTNWALGEPNNDGDKGEDYTTFRFPEGDWNDVGPFIDSGSGIIEVPDPTLAAGSGVIRAETGHRYIMLTGYSCLGAEAVAQRHFGGHLASINDEAEREWISGHIVSAVPYYIGLTDKDSEGTWVWTDGSPVTYLNWEGGEPNNSYNEDFTEVYPGGTWNDRDETYFVCSWWEHRSLIEVPPAGCHGDADLDGDIDFADITAVLTFFTATGGPFRLGDADGSGVVNFSDITEVLTNFNSGCS